MFFFLFSLIADEHIDRCECVKYTRVWCVEVYDGTI